MEVDTKNWETLKNAKRFGQQKQKMLEEPKLHLRTKMVLKHLNKELRVLQMKNEIQSKFKSELDKRKSREIEVHDKPSTNSEEWNIIDGRGKTCAGVLAALTNQINENPYSYVEAILADALNIYDVIVWAEEGNHEVITKRTDADGSVRVLFKPNAMRLKESSK